jgi:spermidine synthase
VKRLTVAEIEPLIPQVVSTYFRRENHDVVRDPRVRIVFDDARHFVQQTGETYDVITSDPIHPWVKGSATLFTREYFELLKARLNAGGLVTQWVPLYESNADVVRSELATFFEVFPQATVWANRQRGGGYDLVLLGPREEGRIDLDAIRSRLQDSAHAAARESLSAVAFNDPLSIFGTYTARASDLRGWLQGAEINRDSSLRLQYLAGLQSNVYEGDAIYAAIRQHRVFPEGLFEGSAEAMSEIRALLAAAR